MKENFKLQKVKLLNNGGLSIQYEIVVKSGSETFYDGETVNSARTPHPDLTAALKRLKTVLMKVYGFDYALQLEYLSKKALEDIKEAFQKIENSITVTGIAISGKDEFRGIITMGVFETEFRNKVAINTHRIIFDGNKYGLEELLNDCADTIENECYLYLFEGKRAQLEIPFDEQGELELENEPVS
jgi:hypothetical protein